MKKIINKLLFHFGYRISKIRPNLITSKTMAQALNSLARTHKINTIVDIGASDGRWSLLAMKTYPASGYLLVEAQPVHEQSLKHFVSLHNNCQYVLAAAGDKEGEIYFDANDPLGGQASYKPYPTNNIIVPVTKIDTETKKRGMQGPYLLKFDVHGFEVPILKGSSETLLQTEVVIMECYNFKIGEECLLFYEMCSYMKELGFRNIDLVDPLWRPHDNALWQMDLVFVREDRPEFSYLGYE
jgi:FkbM family methyltransferase